MTKQLQFKIRCSQIAKIMTEPKTKAKKEAGELSETTISYLKSWWVENTFNRKKEFYSDPTQKGNEVEEEAITLLTSTQRLGIIEKNEINFENDFLTGTPDIIIESTKKTIWDTKASWDIFTFPFLETELPNKDYDWQMQGYMALTGADTAKIAYCLIDTPKHLILREAYQQANKLGIENIDEIIGEIEKRHTFGDIPKQQKIKIFEVKRDQIAIDSIYKQVEKCRLWIQTNC